MQPLCAHSWAEAHMYLKVTPCPNCSRGPWEITSEQPPTESLTLLARCLHCRTEKKFLFECAGAPPGPEDSPDLPIELINPTPEPSRIIDLGQWLSLFYMLVEKASSTGGAESRRGGFQAAQCLDEALKFYTEDDELPPTSAFFVKASRQAFAEHPEKFARQRLRDMRNKLPDLRIMAKRIARDAGEKKPKHWWQFRKARRIKK